MATRSSDSRALNTCIISRSSLELLRLKFDCKMVCHIKYNCRIVQLQRLSKSKELRIMSRHEGKKYVFTVKDTDDFEHWIAFEPSDGNLEVLSGGMLGFRLEKGTSTEKADQIASYMNINLGELMYVDLS